VREVTANAALFDAYRRAVDDSGFGDMLEGPEYIESRTF
jgi:hypothetical protein